MSRRNRQLRGTGVGSLLLGIAGAGGLAATFFTAPPAARAQAAQAPQAQEGQQVQLGDTVINANDIEYDFASRQYIFSGKVDVVSKDSRMTADKMTVQMTPKNETQWTKCEGNVFVEKRDPAAQSKMTGRGRLLEYFDLEQRGVLHGGPSEGVVVFQESPRLAKPAVITGSRVEMDNKNQINTVYRSDSAQAKVHIEPKGEEGKPNPEPADLIGDQIVQNNANQEYVATGKPLFVRPSSKIQAKKIRFTVEPKSNEINVAYAEENVIVDGKNENGSIIHATGDKGVFNRETNMTNMTGSVYATVLDPGQEKPQVFQGDSFLYNNKTGYRKLSGASNGKPASVLLPQQEKKPGETKTGDPKPGDPKPGGAKPAGGGTEKK